MMTKWCWQVAVCSMAAFAGCSSPARNLGDANGAGGSAGVTQAASGGQTNGGQTNGGNTSGGLAGDSGDAGAAGQATPQSCVTDADCSDQRACTGVETCVMGSCKPGTPACTNPDPAHCAVVCVENAGSPTCTVQGQDSDKDTHLSALCAAKPGDDCDDTSAAVHPGAKEICDGVDNDCNGMWDVGDGVALMGTTKSVASAPAVPFLPVIASGPDLSVYGVTFSDQSSAAGGALFFEELDADGDIALAATGVDYGTLASRKGVNLSSGGGTFGVSWWGTDLMDWNFRRIDGVSGKINNDGSLTEPSGVHYGRSSYSVYTTSGWRAFFAGSGNSLEELLGSATIPAWTQGKSVGYSYTGDEVASVHESIAPAGTGFVIAAGGGQPPRSSVALWDSTLSTSIPLSVTGIVPIVGPGPTGFGIAVQAASAAKAPLFYAYSSTGSAQCGPLVIGDKDFVPAAIVATPKGYLVASSDLRAQEVLTGCKLGQLFTVEPGATGVVSMARSKVGYAVAWNGSKGGQVRTFGLNFCN